MARIALAGHGRFALCLGLLPDCRLVCPPHLRSDKPETEHRGTTSLACSRLLPQGGSVYGGSKLPIASGSYRQVRRTRRICDGLCERPFEPPHHDRWAGTGQEPNDAEGDRQKSTVARRQREPVRTLL